MLYNAELVHDDGLKYFHRVDNKYSPPGHTCMENDRAFGIISRKAKKQQVIGSKAWMKLGKKSKRPNYHTMWVDQEHFRDRKGYLSAKYERPSRWKNTEGDIVPFMKIRWFNYGMGEGPDGLVEYRSVVPSLTRYEGAMEENLSPTHSWVKRWYALGCPVDALSRTAGT